MINYVTGDATVPTQHRDEPMIIAHICNDAPAWGAGFVLSVSRRWPHVKKAYLSWGYDTAPIISFRGGEIQLVHAEHSIFICNMIAQHGLSQKEGVPPIRYFLLESCLRKLNIVARALQASIHMPQIGTGLAGGDWDRIEPLIKRTLNSAFPTTIYTLEDV